MSSLIKSAVNKIGKKVSTKEKAVLSMAIAAGALLVPEVAFAYDLSGSGITVGKIAENLTASIQGASTLVTALAYLGAISFGFIGALKWKEHGNQPDRTPLKVPMTYWGISAICAALPEFIGTGIASMWGDGATLVTQQGAVL
jgi:hypothetical protein